MKYDSHVSGEFKGLMLSYDRIHIPRGGCQIDINGDRRLRGAWRARPGYARLLAGSSTITNTGSDDFDRANGALGANWTSLGGAAHTIASNQILINSTSQVTAADIYNAVTFQYNHASECDIAVVNLGTDSGPMVRANATGGYAFLYNSGITAIRLVRLDFSLGGLNSIADVLGTYTVTLTNGQTLRLSAVGSTLQGEVDGVIVLTATDTTFTQGSPGVCTLQRGSSQEIELDNWNGYDIKEDPVSVSTGPSRMFAFERDDDQSKLMVAYSTSMDEFNVGRAEWT